ncbi:cyclin-dependent kinase inhibitor 7 isoform X1 [Vigna radiata var. radiata]|uniref:Cyclin-dependent kinase inhibitor 7 isoform X1 n=1 Tax=Vigna radiata var. radiata TaxID=3916 RepID=A0A1S3UQ82_VIGRR|nr:cyclin-dependent kinase inhibitor 7 isoform X1 [Vigna radiata var. radiata]
MSECKRCTVTIVPMEEASSSEPTISKKRKTSQLRSSDTHHWFFDTTVSPEASVNSAGTVVSGEPCSDRSCCSSSHVKELHTAPLDLQTKGFKTVHSTKHNFKSSSLLSEFSGDSEESTMFPAKSSAEVTEKRKVKEPAKAEIEEFFAMAEKYEQKRFVEKYNFDIVRDMPLEGRYQWVIWNILSIPSYDDSPIFCGDHVCLVAKK